MLGSSSTGTRGDVAESDSLIQQTLHDSGEDDLSAFFSPQAVFPKSQDLPTSSSEQLRSLAVPVPIRQDLRLPVASIVLRESVTPWTSVPEATIDENCQSLPAEKKIRSAWKVGARLSGLASGFHALGVRQHSMYASRNGSFTLPIGMFRRPHNEHSSSTAE